MIPCGLASSEMLRVYIRQFCESSQVVESLTEELLDIALARRRTTERPRGAGADCGGQARP